MDERLDNQTPRGFDAYAVTLGDQMRGERATMGKSLLDVQRDLRIKATYIAAIENCDASAFQSQGFIAGYVRSYARYLNMDADECFVRFCEESGFDGVHPDLTQSKKATPLAMTPARPALADPIAKPRIPNMPVEPGFFSRVSPSALGSVAVLMILIAGLGYGGWSVLQEVQRVQFVPVNQTPGVTADLGEVPTTAPGQQDNVVALSPARPTKPANLDQLYRPQELEVPQMVARDAPIATIDAGSVGAYADRQVPILPKVEEVEPPVTVAEGPPAVDIVAQRPAWVQIYFDDGSVLFERILDAGESYRIPPDVQGAKLRTGNAGGTFAKIGDVVYGPMGSSGGVVRDIGLTETALVETFDPAQDVFTDPLDPPLNLDELKATVEADSSAVQE